MNKDTSLEINQEDLAEAFKAPKKSKKGIFAIITFVVGLILMVVGVVLLVLKLTAGPAVLDAEYLVEKGDWVLEEECGEEVADSSEEAVEGACGRVIWKFTEVGKGVLTTNGHKNDYDFIWAIEGDKLKIETKWLYDLNDEYSYKLNQGEGTLTLEKGEETFIFKHKML